MFVHYGHIISTMLRFYPNVAVVLIKQFSLKMTQLFDEESFRESHWSGVSSYSWWLVLELALLSISLKW